MKIKYLVYFASNLIINLRCAAHGAADICFYERVGCIK